MARVVVVRGKDPYEMVPKGLDLLGVKPDREKVVIKPNLILQRNLKKKYRVSSVLSFNRKIVTFQL